MDKNVGTIDLDDEDFEAIEQAVLETERGRWFLAEYAARNRRAETTTLLSSIARLERAVNRDPLTGEISASHSEFKRLATDLETLIGALALPSADDRDPITGLATTLALSAYALATDCDHIRDRFGVLRHHCDADQEIDAIEQSLERVIDQAARQAHYARHVEALAKILTFCRERLAFGHGTKSLMTEGDAEPDLRERLAPA